MFFKKNRCYDMGFNPGMNNCMVNMPVDPNFDVNNDGMVNTADIKAAGMMPMGQMDSVAGCKMQPVMECPVEKCVHRTICHEVPHVCPINTRIINHHVYRHTFAPQYSCCEENKVSHVQEGSCCNFR